jgi:hypothetical protein
MRKIPGVKAVRVSLNEGLTVLDFNAGNTVTLAQLRAVLKNSGFVSKEAKLEATGTVAANGQGLVFTVAGTGEAFTVLPGPTNRTAYENLTSRLQAGSAMVELKGTTSTPDGKAPSLVVEAVQ